jgi:uncharacterized protein YggE
MRTLLCLVVLPLAAWSQLDDQTVTVTASRQLPSPQPDQAVLSLSVSSPITASLNDVLAALAGSGFSAANLAGVEYGSTSPTSITVGLPATNPSIYWIFMMTVPLSDLGPALAAIGASAAASPMPVTYSVYSQVSPQLQASQQCPYALLVADAQSQAQGLASAAGATVGAILAVSDGSAAPGSQVIVSGYLAAVLPASRIAPASISGVLGIPDQVPCTMTVQFALAN